MGYVLAVDGGNTKTVALVARHDGTIVGAGRGGCSDIYHAGAGAALTEVERAVRGAFDACGALPAELSSGVFSMAGADWPEDFDLLERSMRSRGFGRTITVINDALGALRAGSADGTGVSVVCGTGIAIGARAADGRLWHGSFWLESLGAGALGRKALRAVYRAELGLDPPTKLTARVLEFFGSITVEQVLHQFTAREVARPRNEPQLARVLLDEAGAGDATARRIVIEHGAALGDYALAAACQVGIEATPFTLVLAGGVLRHPVRLLHEALIERVRSSSPDVLVVDSRFEPVIGALLLALESTGIPIDEALLARLTPTLPATGFFAT
jgi:N-acetylglucosamine kinase-like BadF-type ATPase